MNEQAITVILSVLTLIFVLWLLVKLTKKIRPMTKGESFQHDVNKYASEPTYNSGVTKRGLRFWIMFIIVVIVLILGLLLAYSSGNSDFHI